MSAEALHIPRLEKIDLERLKALALKVANWAGPIATKAVLGDANVRKDISRSLTDKAQPWQSRVMGALKTAGSAVGNALLREGAKQAGDRLNNMAQEPRRTQARKPETPRQERTQPRHETKEAAEFKTRFVDLTTPYLPPSEKPADPKARRLIQGDQPNMQREDGAVRINIYDDARTNQLGASLIEHVDVDGNKATRVTEYSNFSDGIRVRTTDFVDVGPDKPADIRPLDPVQPGVFGVPATAEHMQRLEGMAGPDSMTQWQEPRLMPGPNQVA